MNDVLLSEEAGYNTVYVVWFYISRLVNFGSKRSGGKYFKFCGSYSLCHTTQFSCCSAEEVAMDNV